MSALTVTLNKVSHENRDRLILALCQDIEVQCCQDARVIVQALYHRAVHDGSFHGDYAKVLKALHKTYPAFFEIVEFPDCWMSFNKLVDSLVLQENGNFLSFVDQKQRRRVLSVSLIEFLGHLFLNGLWDAQQWFGELWCTSTMKATCRKGLLLHRLIMSFQEVPFRSELYIECTCKLLQIIGGAGLDVLDPSRCLKQKVSNRLNSILHATRPESQHLGRRMCFLLEETLMADWARTCIETHKVQSQRQAAEHVEAAEMESRMDPQDGKSYTLIDLLEYYGRGDWFTQRDIKLYFAYECRPVQRSRASGHRQLRRRQGGGRRR